MKDFLSEYGFAILAAVVVILLIAMCTPVGSLIKNQVVGIVNKFAIKTENRLYSTDTENEFGVIIKQVDDSGSFSISAISESDNDLFEASYRVKDQHGNWNDWTELGLLSTGSKEHSGVFTAKIENGNKIQIRVTDNGKANDVFYQSNIIEYTGKESTNTGTMFMMPNVGDLITIDGKQFRVLKTEGTTAKVLGMFNNMKEWYNNHSTVATFKNGKTGQKYEGSLLDVRMNQTFYNSLSEQNRNAIIPKNVEQRIYNITYSKPSSGVYYTSWNKNYFKADDTSGNTYYIVDMNDVIELGERRVWNADILDIVEYLGESWTPQQLMMMFYNVDYGVNTDSNEIIWLKSATTWNDGALQIIGHMGGIGANNFNYYVILRPCFYIDLSQANFSM